MEETQPDVSLFELIQSLEGGSDGRVSYTGFISHHIHMPGVDTNPTASR